MTHQNETLYMQKLNANNIKSNFVSTTESSKYAMLPDSLTRYESSNRSLSISKTHPLQRHLLTMHFLHPHIVYAIERSNQSFFWAVFPGEFSINSIDVQFGLDLFYSIN